MRVAVRVIVAVRVPLDVLEGVMLTNDAVVDGVTNPVADAVPLGVAVDVLLMDAEAVLLNDCVAVGVRP